MQHCGQQDGDRLAEIYLGPQLGVAEDAGRFAQVALDRADSGVRAAAGDTGRWSRRRGGTHSRLRAARTLSMTCGSSAHLGVSRNGTANSDP
jgi:hypothetical protein